jgi:type I site-specific restriction endonuclease
MLAGWPTSRSVRTAIVRSGEKTKIRSRRRSSSLPRFNEPFTSEDLIALENIFLEEGTTRAELLVATEEARGLDLFVRALVGMDREAAKVAVSHFMQGRLMTANQIEFTNPVISHLASRGWIDLPQLYASPFTDLHPHGIDGIFDDGSTQAWIAMLQSIRQNAAGNFYFPSVVSGKWPNRFTVMQARIYLRVLCQYLYRRVSIFI